MDGSSTDRLGIRVGRLQLQNPVICGSGEPVMTEAGIRAALAAGAAGVIAKSINEQEAAARELDRADYALLDAQGSPVTSGKTAVSLFCRSGLAQREVKEWFASIASIDCEAQRQGRFVAASIVLASHEGAEQIASLAHSAGLRIFELNVGAPHASEAKPGAIAQETDPESLGMLVRRVRTATRDMQLWVKLTGLSNNLPALAVAAKESGADAVIMMGRFMGLVPDLETFAPLLGTSAAYGGPWALPIVCRFLALSRRAVGPAFSLLGTNGVRSGEDVVRMALAGASAVEVMSVVMQEGFAGITRVIEQLGEFLERRGLRFVDIVGRSADALQTYAQQPEVPGRWKAFVPPESLIDEARQR
jgi:dihydroorotate dehydrogenase (NAD+) catalytic subunit